MKKLLLASITMLSLVMSSCSKDDDNGNQPKGESTLQGTIATNTRLTKDKIWYIKGYVYVKEGTTLTIEPGTILKGDVTEKGILIVERGAWIVAQGTAAEPIVFTSGMPAGSRNPGDWGGIFILGKGITNQGAEVAAEGLVNRNYGGTNNADSSGVLSYVRIEYAGLPVSTNSEINALSLAGVGSKTKIDHIQVFNAKDDGIECWGGAVNLKYVALFGTLDDDLDFDYGYQGKVQFAYVVKNPTQADANDPSNGIECDNENSATATPEPFTRPVLSNITLLGPNSASANAQHNYAMRWRRETKFAVYNSVFAGWLKGGFSIESNETATGYTDGSSAFKNNLVHSIAAPYLSNSAVITAAAMQTKAESEGCVTMTSSTQVLNAAAFNLTSIPNPLPLTGSVALTGAVYTDADVNNSFFEKVAFKGAFGTNNWLTEGNWISMNGQTNEYK